MKNIGEKICKYLVYMAIIFMPITSLMYNGKQLPSALSEISFVLWILTTLIFFFIKLLNKENIKIPNNPSLMLLLIILSCMIVGFVLNFNNIYAATYLEQTGISRYIISIGSFLLCIMGYIALYNILLVENTIEILKTSIIISFFVAATYSLFEIGGGFLQISWMLDVMREIDNYIHPQQFVLRLRSICLEPSFFGVYASLVLPWIVYIISNGDKYKKIVYSTFMIYLFIMMILASSRQLYVMLLAELLLLAVVYKRHIYNNKFKIIFMFCTSILSVCVVLMSIDFGDYNFDIVNVINSLSILEGESNLARYGGQATAFNIFIDNPLFGIGYGQYAFRFEEYMPNFAYQSDEFIGYLMQNGRMPMVHGLYARLLAEIGVCGFVFWILLWVILLIKLLKLYAFSDGKYKLYIGNLIISVLMVSFNWFSWESMTNFMIWLYMTISSIMIDKKLEGVKNART